MRTWLRFGLALPAAAICLAAAPQPAAAHDEPFVSIAATRNGGIHLRLGHHPRIAHERRLHEARVRAARAHQLEKQRALRAQHVHQLLHRQQQLRQAAARAQCAGDYRAARRLLAHADRIRASEGGYRGWR